jgi:RimJ/RimL family protein N-acetyltransferase
MVLRELSRRDIAHINRWRHDRSVIEGLAAPFRYIDVEVDEAWFDRYLAARDQQVRCAVCEDAGPICGVVSLTSIDRVHRSAEFHIMIGEPQSRGRGLGTDATREMVRHAFRDLNLHRVYLTVREGNAAARKLYEKVGFKVEGLLRDAVYKDGRFENLVMMAILESDDPIS